MRALFLVLIACTCLAAQETKPASEVSRRRWDQLSEAEKAQLRQRWEKYRSFSREERERIRENLAQLKKFSPENRKRILEQFQKVPPEERIAYQKLARETFRFLRSRYADQGGLQGFPHGMFFRWMKGNHPQFLQRLQNLEESARKDALLKMYVEFNRVIRRRVLMHGRRHGCLSRAQIQELKDYSVPMFWEKWRTMMTECRTRRARSTEHGPGRKRNKSPDAGRDPQKKR